MGRNKESVLPLSSNKMLQNNSFKSFRERYFSKKSKKDKTVSCLENIESRPRSSSICSINFPASEDMVEESLARGLPIITFGFPTFVIEEEDPVVIKHRVCLNKEKDNHNEMNEKGTITFHKKIIGSRRPKLSGVGSTNSVKEVKEKAQSSWSKTSLKPPLFPKSKVDKMQKTKSMDLKFNIFGSGDIKISSRKNSHKRTFTKKDDYMFLDYTKNLKTRNNMKKGDTL